MVLDLNHEMIDEVSLEETLNRIKSCMQCGTCTSVCPANRFAKISARALIRKAMAGDKTVLSDIELWHCSTCFTCMEQCPRNIPVTEIILKLRNMATRLAFAPDPLKSVIKNVIDTGHAVPINKQFANFREFHHLPRLPPTVHSDERALDEVQRIFDVILFKRRIPYR
jgi:heterodisulfide reductase subunit C